MSASSILIRTDASLDIGTGHVMRCLTLAEALREHGASCRFVCRAHPGNLIDLIRQRGFDVQVLPFDSHWIAPANSTLTHAAWLGADWETDAEQTKVGAGETVVDWMIVDHYALDARWESALKIHYRKLMVIDDLADRPHVCDVLLDQTFGRNDDDYRSWVPANCRLLCGSEFALLRPEFEALRPYSLLRRAKPQLRQLLISMGGVDIGNVTERVLEALRACQLPTECQIIVVMGMSAPWLAEIERQAQSMPWPTRVMVGVSDMAQLMADSDLAIGAAGTTSWERCCLGLPTAMMVLAENQRGAAWLLEQAQAVHMLHLDRELPNELAKFIGEVVKSEEYLKQLGEKTKTVTDGKGCQRVADRLISGER